MKILYLMHINWCWIRQRPHIFSELLAVDNELFLMHFSIYKSGHKSAEKKPSFPARVIWRIPDRLIKSISLFEYFNIIFLKYQIHKQLEKFKPDIIWLTHPIFYPVIKDFSGLKVIYDCMDDHLAFSSKDLTAFKVYEKSLVEMADITLFSSKTLSSRVYERSCPRKSMVINNGTGLSIKSKADHITKLSAGDGVALGYFGTISHWFDWELMHEVLNSIPNANLYLAGPIEVTMHSHSRIHYLGVLPHEYLAQTARSFDLMIMPFIVNRLIEAVDPVKLYEYISYGLPSAAPAYPETLRFSPYVYLYSNSSDLIEFILNCRKRRKDTISAENNEAKSREKFLSLNSWQARAKQLNQVIKDLS